MLTLLISRPSSASSLLRSSASFLAFSSGLSSGLSLSNSGFLRAILNASAMIAASAPENRPDSCAELLREIREPSSAVVLPGTPRAPTGTGPVASAVVEPLGPSRGEESWPAAGLSVIIGVAEVTESRWVLNFRLRILQNKKRRTQVTKRAKKPKTEITAIAQWGKDEMSWEFCTLPVGFKVEVELVGKDDDEDMVESIELG